MTFQPSFCAGPDLSPVDVNSFGLKFSIENRRVTDFQRCYSSKACDLWGQCGSFLALRFWKGLFGWVICDSKPLRILQFRMPWSEDLCFEPSYSRGGLHIRLSHTPGFIPRRIIRYKRYLIPKSNFITGNFRSEIRILSFPSPESRCSFTISPLFFNIVSTRKIKVRLSGGERVEGGQIIW